MSKNETLKSPGRRAFFKRAGVGAGAAAVGELELVHVLPDSPEPIPFGYLAAKHINADQD